MSYIAQTAECGGVPRTEYRYEPEIADDPEPEYALVCGSCDYFRVSGCCALTSFKRQSTSLACPEIKITSPF